jgi:hypothetical protein
MVSISVKTRFLCIASTLLATASAQTHGWTSPVTLSTGGQGSEAAAAIDGNGNSVALWDERTTQDQLWSRSKPSGGSWGSVTEVSPALQTVSVLPVVGVTTTGFATAVWNDQSGVWTADRPAGSNWNPAQLLIPGVSSPVFVMDSQGDAAIAWTVGGPRSSSGSVMAVLRPAGKIWTAQQLVASGVHVIADHAGIGDNGAVIVTWESYNATCTRYGCSTSAYVLHASRQNAGSSGWIDSGPLIGPDLDGHDARVALDSTSRAILVASSKSGAYVSATQGASSGAWSSFNTVFNPSGITMITDLLSDDAGQVTLVYEAIIGFSGSQALAVNGSTGNNTWSSSVVLSGSDSIVGQIFFAVAPGGTALVVWLSSGGATPQVHAITRATGTGNWSSPVAISGPGSEIGPEAAAVNSAGDAIVIYSGYDVNSVHTEYAVNYQP